MKYLTNEINGLLNEILVKDTCLTALTKCSKEYGTAEKEMAEKVNTINQLNIEIQELESKGREKKIEINELQTQLHEYKHKVPPFKV